jgi:hypothetical protein
MQRDEPAGWMPAMLVFSSLAVTLMAGAWLGLPIAWAISVIGVLDLLATAYFVSTGIRRVWRLGVAGPMRPRWWIEIAAIDWTLIMSCGCFVAVHRKNWLVELAFTGTTYLLPAFFVFAIAGYLLGLLRGKSVRGSSLELVNFFFWMIVGIWVSIWAIPGHPALGGWLAASAGLVGIGAASLAGVLEIRRRVRSSRIAKAE